MRVYRRARVDWVDPDAGVRWVIIKQRSEPESKRVFEEVDPDDGVPR